MPAQPPSLPQWDNNNTDVTVPSAGQIADGYALNSRPTRQVLNYLFRLWSQWTQWLDQVRHPTDLVLADSPLPGGVPPEVGPGTGLNEPDGNFNARVVAAGRHVPLTGNPLYVYTASRDHYWDLSRDGVWTAVVVNVGDPAPAVTANSTRVYMVRTDGVDKVLLQSWIPEAPRARALTFIDTVRLSLVGTLTSALGGVSTDLQRRTPKLLWITDQASGATYEQLEELATNGAAIRWRRYHALLTGNYMWVRGAYPTVTSGVVTWMPEATAVRLIIETPTGTQHYTLTGLTIGVPFADASWLTASATEEPREIRRTGVQYSIPGNGAAADGFYYPHVEHLSDGVLYTPIEQSVLASSQLVRYLGTALLGSAGGEAWAVNAKYNPGTNEWSRQEAGDSFLELRNRFGRTLLRRLAAGASPWPDSISAGAWEVVAQETTTLNLVRALRPLETGAGSNFSNTLYQRGISKADALIQIRSGVVTVFNACNVTSVVITGLGNPSVRVTMPLAMSGEYLPLVTVSGLNNWILASPTPISSTVFDILFARVSSGSLVLADLSTEDVDIVFSVRGVHA